MIDPCDITKYDRTEAELQEFLLFCISTAGGNSSNRSRSINELILRVHKVSPGEPVFWFFAKDLSIVHNHLVLSHVGIYGQLERAICDVCALLDFERSVSELGLDDLLTVRGIGPKIARMFLVHSRPDQHYAILDTHVLNWLATVHGVEEAKKRPTNEAKYRQLEGICLAFYDRFFRGRTCAEADLFVWLTMSGRMEDEEQFWPKDENDLYL